MARSCYPCHLWAELLFGLDSSIELPPFPAPLTASDLSNPSNPSNPSSDMPDTPPLPSPLSPEYEHETEQDHAILPVGNFDQLHVKYQHMPQPGNVMCNQDGQYMVCLGAHWTADEKIRMCVVYASDRIDVPAQDINMDIIDEFIFSSSASPLFTISAQSFKNAPVWVDGSDLIETGLQLPSVSNRKLYDQCIIRDRQRMHKYLYDPAICKKATDFYDRTAMNDTMRGRLPPNMYPAPNFRQYNSRVASDLVGPKSLLKSLKSLKSTNKRRVRFVK